MRDESKARWKQRGRVFIWRYEGNPRNYRGWHLTADELGARSLTEFLKLVEKGEFPAKTRIELSEQTRDRLAANCPRRPLFASRCIIAHTQSNTGPDDWSLNESNGEVLLEFGVAKASELLRGINDIEMGRGDYFMGRNGEELWFWPHLEDASR